MERCVDRVWVVAVLGSVGCASGPMSQSSFMAGVVPILSVEWFLQAVNTGDLQSMARIFGTAQGSMADRAGSSFSCGFKRVGSWIGLGDGCMARSEIELRMNAIAVILQHDDYRIQTESAVPGRERPTTQVSVSIQRGAERFTDVPFTVVQASDGRWLVEEIGPRGDDGFRSSPGPAPTTRHLRCADEQRRHGRAPFTPGRGSSSISSRPTSRKAASWDRMSGTR